MTKDFSGKIEIFLIISIISVFFYNGTSREFFQKSIGILTPKKRDIPVALDPMMCQLISNSNDGFAT